MTSSLLRSCSLLLSSGYRCEGGRPCRLLLSLSHGRRGFFNSSSTPYFKFLRTKPSFSSSANPPLYSLASFSRHTHQLQKVQAPDYGPSYLSSHRSCDLDSKLIGEKISVLGWVESIRCLSNQLAFLPIRDGHGKVQAVVRPPHHASLEPLLKELTPESVVFVKGVLLERPSQAKKAGVQNADVELEVHHLELLNKSDPLPFEIHSSPLPAEDVRLRYRYLDLRRAALRNALHMRSTSVHWFRTWFHAQGFLDIDTPLLFKPTPEGAREFVVGTRTRAHVYALPQSPQQFKQLLMVAGVPRYFQLAKCFRDEDQRRDRQPEFTQLDVEVLGAGMDDLMALAERAVASWLAHLVPSAHPLPRFPRLTHEAAVRRFGTDKPDLRSPHTPYAFVWVTHFPLFSRAPMAPAGGSAGGPASRWVATHHPFTAPTDTAMLDDGGDLGRVTGMHFDLVLNGVEVGGGSVRIHQREVQEKVFALLGIDSTSFEHWLTAMRYGCPPHGGFALGLDRLLSIVLDTPSIRDVIAFPKSQGVDLMVQAPSRVDEATLKEYHLQVLDKKG